MEQFYTTRDLIEASTLVTLKFRVVNITYQIEGRKNLPIGYFEFENSERLQQAVNAFHNCELAVEPKEFFTHVKALKSRVTGFCKSPNTDFDQLKKN